MKKKALSVILTAALAGSMLAACGSTGSATPAAPAQETAEEAAAP